MKEYVRLGMKVTKIHRILQFQQAPWLKTFIDFNEYPDNHPCFKYLDSETISKLKTKNKKVVGGMKDELDNDVISEFVGLRAKCYSFLATNEKKSKKKNKENEKECHS